MRLPENEVLSLFANCIPVKGDKRSIICDVYRGRFRFIPDALYLILTKFKKNTIAEIKRYFKNENDNIINDYFIFLIENEFGFFCSKKEQKLFPKLNLNFETSYLINNCIIDVNRSSNHDFKNLFEELEQLYCAFWQIRIYEDFRLAEIENILSFTKDIHLNSMHLIIPYHKEMTTDKLLRLYNQYPIAQIDFHTVASSKIAWYNEKLKQYPLNFYEKNISDERHCGIINSKYFNPNITLFSESQNFNSCLNQKISIDVTGEIKNCPSMKESFGNIKDTSLHEAINKKGFKKYWTVNKDKIEICKDCEFRYICVDCRAYLTNPEDMYSKPLKCGYNPYTSTWEEWSDNPLKDEAIKYYGL